MRDKEINKDKRLLLPRDKFEEEASEGLGRLNREEASEDLRELKGRMERRVRKPRMIWLPAAAAVAVLLVASTVYITLFRDRNKQETEIATTEKPVTDTVLIAMAQPIQKAESDSRSREAIPETKRVSKKSGTGVVRSETRDALAEAGEAHGMIAEDKDEVAAIPESVQEMVAEEEVSAEVSEVVVVEVLPGMGKTAAYEKMEKAAGNDKKEKAPATKTAEDSARATPSPGFSVPGSEAEPVGGMEELNRWIQKNIRYPEEVTPRVQQAVVVTFKISADSTLYDLKAEQAAGKSFTNEAFRLLREGPKWVPAIRNGKVSEEEVRVSIVFK
jgi:hypothetical protein